MKNSTAIILILISIGLFYTFTNSQYAKVKNLSLELDKYKEVLQGAAAISETTEKLGVLYEKVSKEEVARLEKILPNNADTVRLALDLDAIASRYGISIKNVQVDKQKQDNAGTIDVSSSSLPYEKVFVTFSFVSNYTNFTKFLSDIERSLRIMNVRSIEFQSNEAGLYEHKMTVETYWLK